MATWNLTAAVQHLDESVENSSTSKCAKYVREAIEAGGVTWSRHPFAKDYGSSLLAAGFTELLFCTNQYKAGDVVIIQPIPGHPEGHMTMFDGTSWVSDFVQRSMYPGPTYRKLQPSFAVYRWQGSITKPDTAANLLTK